jgi:hypothetical protein
MDARWLVGSDVAITIGSQTARIGPGSCAAPRRPGFAPIGPTVETVFQTLIGSAEASGFPHAAIYFVRAKARGILRALD